MIPFSKRTLEQVRKTHLLIISERAEWWLICKNQSSSYKYKKRKIQIIINASYLYFLATGKRLFAMSENSGKQVNHFKPPARIFSQCRRFFIYFREIIILYP